MPYYQEMDTKTRNMMIRKYIEETGLNIAQDFDIDNFNRWLNEKSVFDQRTAEQRRLGQGTVFSLTEVLAMTQEEADAVGAGEYRRIWLEKEKEREQRKREQFNTSDKFVSGETADELTEAYFKETGKDWETTEKEDFNNWLDGRAVKYLKDEFGEDKADLINNLADIYNRAIDEIGLDEDNKIDYDKFKEWCNKTQTPLPPELINYLST